LQVGKAGEGDDSCLNTKRFDNTNSVMASRRQTANHTLKHSFTNLDDPPAFAPQTLIFNQVQENAFNTEST